VISASRKPFSISTTFYRTRRNWSRGRPVISWAELYRLHNTYTPATLWPYCLAVCESSFTATSAPAAFPSRRARSSRIFSHRRRVNAHATSRRVILIPAHTARQAAATFSASRIRIHHVAQHAPRNTPAADSRRVCQYSGATWDVSRSFCRAATGPGACRHADTTRRAHH
jgi:hypothetical protein